MKNVVDRIEKLEGRMAPINIRMLGWNDDDEEELETVIERDRETTGFTGQYFVTVGVSGQWKEVGKDRVWLRPPRAAARYEKWGSYAPHSETNRDVPG